MTAEVWHKPLWYCADCGEGYEGSSDSTTEVQEDADEHDRLNHSDD